MQWARIKNGKVAEIMETNPAGRFHHSMQWVRCGTDTRPGWLFDGEQCLPPPPASLDTLVVDAIRRVNAGYSSSMAQILNEYPDAETLSFDKQEREAREWHIWYDPKGNNSQGSEPATPYIDAMLAERPIGKTELVIRIITKANAFVAAHGSATGRRQRLEDDIKAALEAKDRETLEAIKWSNAE
ncbi:hypothetical protein ACT3TY_05365 [Halomonas sp. AOP22-C1-8]|uniref:hypothetical protein n=1 Tax=Halomonas sp. AOP22-C1-8 TaxID=3457717 RepID=UPI004034CADA